MNKELIIDSSPTDVNIAMLEDGQLTEIHKEKANQNFSVGDIFLGRVKKLMPGLNAAFIDIGHKRDAFLHYTDLGPQLQSLLKYTRASIAGSLQTSRLDNFKKEKDIIKTGKINEVLDKNEKILVQILKEPISTKGPRLSCELTLPGRYIVLTPFNDVIAISKKIANNEERKRLRTLIESIKPKMFGVIVRTAAEGKKVADLHEEMSNLMGKWKEIHDELHTANPPKKLLSELDKTSSILRDLMTDDFNRIVVNDKEMHDNLKTYIKSFAPKRANIVEMYRSRAPIYDKFGITKQIKSSFGKTSTMKSGAYIIIEKTEAMHVIDVNSGPKSQQDSQEDAAIKVNLEAAEEIARQLRLRDIGGLIIIDFIDMRNKKNRYKLNKAMKEFMAKDRAQHTILHLSRFGLMQITRQRVRPAVSIDTSEDCPTCGGTGKITSSILITDDIERDLEFILKSRPKAKLVLQVHPFIDAYIKRGIPSMQMNWYFKYGKWIKVRPINKFALTEWKFFDGEHDEIRLNK